MLQREVETPLEDRPVYWLYVLIGVVVVGALLGALMLAGGEYPG